jgi:hypothetical protein
MAINTGGAWIWVDCYYKKPPPPPISKPGGTSGSTSTTSKVNSSTATITTDYLNKSLNFVHTVSVEGITTISPSSWDSASLGAYDPALQNGSTSGSIDSSRWTVTAATGAWSTAAASLPASSDNSIAKPGSASYNRTLSLGGTNVGVICQGISASPKNYSMSSTYRTSGDYNVGWNISKSSSGTASSSVCANVNSEWTVSSSVSVNRNIAAPKSGYDNVTFSHGLNGNNHVLKVIDGINNADVAVRGTVYQTSTPAGAPNYNTLQYLDARNSDGYAAGVNSFTVTPDGNEIGKNICQYIVVNKQKWNNQTALTGGANCVNIPYNYTTSLGVTGISSEDLREAGEQVKISKTLRVDAIANPALSNASYKTKTVDNITERVVCYVNDNPATPCPGTIWSESSSVTTRTFKSTEYSGNVGSSVTFTVPADASIGTIYCFYAKVDNYGKVANGVNGGGQTSPDKKCIRVVKGPTLQIHGADSWSGVSCSGVVNAGRFISKEPVDQVNVVSSTWSQYGLFSIGSIGDGFGSGGWIRPVSTANLTRSRMLKFASNPNAGEYINNSRSHCLTSLWSYYQRYSSSAKDTSATANLNTILNNTSASKIDIGTKTIWYGEGDKTLSLGGADLKETNLTLIVDGDITINSNVVTYGGTYSSIGALPNLTVITSGDIIIGANVTRLEGIYAANGTIFDCGNTSYIHDEEHNDIFDLNNTCKNPLLVKGAFISNSQRFQRTYGAENIYTATPAEIVSYPTAIWLQEYDYRKNLGGGIKTTLNREMAPRI